ncbi:MAG: hypothetical protein H0U85_06315 [Gemmatimonadales bacterium]|nr:hypothetical protein [Gemmatimonadales bacterium]
MNRALPLALTLALLGCPTYHEYPKLSDQKGYVPADQYARYGTEQAQAMAVAREYGRAQHGGSRADQARSADAAAKYARTLPDVVNITPDSLGYRLTIEFRSGWRTMVNPIDDGKRGSQTANLPGAPAPAASR